MLPHIPEVAMRSRVARIDVVPGPDNTAVIVFAGGSNNHGWVALTGISSYVP
jgi:hypothetical protein